MYSERLFALAMQMYTYDIIRSRRELHVRNCVDFVVAHQWRKRICAHTTFGDETMERRIRRQMVAQDRHILKQHVDVLAKPWDTTAAQ